MVAVLDDFRPHLVVTYDPRGGYGHPDHIRAHEMVHAAVEESAPSGGYTDEIATSSWWSTLLLSFLPLHHIVVLEERSLLPHLEDYAARMAGQPQPRNAILITGPSGTTDIEGSYVRGAHGPGFLHVLMIGG